MPSRKQLEQERRRMRVANGSGPTLAPGVHNGRGPNLCAACQAEEASARDDFDEPTTGDWIALGLVLLSIATFVVAVIVIVKLLRAHAGVPLLLLALAVSSAIGCARMQPAPAPAAPITIPAAPRSPEILVLSEKVGSTVAEIIEAATGQRPFAAAAPGLPIIVFSPKDAADPGLIAHELCHQRQQADMGPLRWSAVYVRDLAECERITARATCLRGGVPLEAECYWISRGINR
jgi:hypothetical protein